MDVYGCELGARACWAFGRARVRASARSPEASARARHGRQCARPSVRALARAPERPRAHAPKATAHVPVEPARPPRASALKPCAAGHPGTGARRTPSLRPGASGHPGSMRKRTHATVSSHANSCMGVEPRHISTGARLGLLRNVPAPRPSLAHVAGVWHEDGRRARAVSGMHQALTHTVWAMRISKTQSAALHTPVSLQQPFSV